MINREADRRGDRSDEVRLLTSESFARLVRTHYADLIHYALRYLRSAAAAEDVVQDVLTRLWERRSELQDVASLRAYLYRAVRNAALNALRNEKSTSSISDLLVDEAMPDDAAEYAQLARDFRASMENLPDRQREAYQLSRLHGLTYEEISEVMGTTVNTTRSQIAAALRHVRAYLSGHL